MAKACFPCTGRPRPTPRRSRPRGSDSSLLRKTVAGRLALAEQLAARERAGVELHDDFEERDQNKSPPEPQMGVVAEVDESGNINLQSTPPHPLLVTPPFRPRPPLPTAFYFRGRETSHV